MTLMNSWTSAPGDQVLLPGECRARDADGQGCAHGLIHLRHPHQSTGLRAWLERRRARDGIWAHFDATLCDPA